VNFISSRVSLTIAALVLVLLTSAFHLQAKETKTFDPARWEKTIQAFEKEDQKAFPPKGAILFVGSSSIRKWELNKYFPDLKTINRGFGGSHMEDPVYYADRIVFPYKPKTIVLYEGDNDISNGKSPETIFADFKNFVKIVHDNLPKIRILYICIKPSMSRWKVMDELRRTNKLIQEYAKKDKKLQYVDVDVPMIGQDGKPRPELFEKDNLHLNHEGYVLWSSIIRRYLKSPAL
jgi:lysophospholipase L1-like esterase